MVSLRIKTEAEKMQDAIDEANPNFFNNVKFNNDNTDVNYEDNEEDEEPKVTELIKNIAEDETENYKEFIDGTKGLANIFVEHHIDRIYMADDKYGYYFNPKTLLWEKWTNKMFNALVMNFFEVYKYTIKLSDQVTEKIIQKFEKAKSAVTDINKCRDIFNKASTDFINETPKFLNQLNKIPNLLPIKNGKVINLDTLEIRYRMRNDFFDYELDIEFNPDSKFTNADKFFNQIACDNTEFVNYLQTLLGYLCGGYTEERIFLVMTGAGSNGKSTLFQILGNIFGKLVISLDKRVILKSKTDSSHSSHLIPLVDAHIGVYSETESGEKLNEGLIKNITGNDKISVREIYENQRTVKPQSKLVILSNELVVFDPKFAMIERFRYFPFNATFVANPKPYTKQMQDAKEKKQYKLDQNFIDKLLNNQDCKNEIFSWICIGASRYYGYRKQNKRIPVPEELKTVTKTYLSDIDFVTQFTNECCTKPETDADRTNRTEVYNDFCIWFKNCGDGKKPINASEFYSKIEGIGYKLSSSQGKRYINLLMKDIPLEPITESKIPEKVKGNAHLSSGFFTDKPLGPPSDTSV